MFPVVSVHQSVILFTEGRGGNVTITHDVFDLTVQGPPSPTPSLQPWHLTVQGPLFLPPANGIWWPSLETCSNLFTSAPPPTGADMWWLLKHVQSCKRAVRILLECFLVTHSLPSTMKLQQGNIFRSVCQEFCPQRGGGGVCLPQCMLGYTHTPGPGQPPGQTSPPPSRRLLLRTVRILLECIMVASKIEEILLQWSKRLIPFTQKMLVKLIEFDKYNNQV